MADRSLSFASLETPIGRLWLFATDAGLRSIVRAEQPEGTIGLPDVGALSKAMRELDEYFAGGRRRFDLRLDLSGATRFDIAVYRAAMQIPYGQTASYGELAALAGSPRAARAVGGAMARCPLFPVVPCHRVIHGDGSIHGWGRELWVKRWLLRHEGWSG
jgi:methylated-DNA-[protein]-cysteine S-methyltransferase